MPRSSHSAPAHEHRRATGNHLRNLDNQPRSTYQPPLFPDIDGPLGVILFGALIFQSLPAASAQHTVPKHAYPRGARSKDNCYAAAVGHVTEYATDRTPTLTGMINPGQFAGSSHRITPQTSTNAQIAAALKKDLVTLGIPPESIRIATSNSEGGFSANQLKTTLKNAPNKAHILICKTELPKEVLDQCGKTKFCVGGTRKIHAVCTDSTTTDCRYNGDYHAYFVIPNNGCGWMEKFARQESPTCLDQGISPAGQLPPKLHDPMRDSRTGEIHFVRSKQENTCTVRAEVARQGTPQEREL